MANETQPLAFDNVRAIAKANVYYEGRVLSHTIFLANGDRKTFGITFPGEYEFGTGDAEVMDVIAGEIEILHPGESAWRAYAPGSSFSLPANCKFRLKCAELSEYVCSYIKE